MVRRTSGVFFPVRQWRGEVDRLFSDFFGRSDSGLTARGRGFPAVTVWEDGDKILVETELPGDPRRPRRAAARRGRILRSPARGDNMSTLHHSQHYAA
jgi:hypothetical protein